MDLMSILSLVCLVACLCVWLAMRQRAAARHMSGEKALRLEIAQLREAAAEHQQARASGSAKTRFLANVSHEVRTPLAGILGLADLLAATKLSAEQGAYVEAIQSCGTALGTLIDEILDFSRIEAGKLELAVEPVDLVTLIEGVVELMAPAAQAKKLEIASVAAADVPRLIFGDTARLRQILLNLVGNAVKFTGQGGVGLKLGLRDRTVDFSVCDTGPGVPENRRSAIFDEFEQADGSTTQTHGGTGLGLAIARRLAHAMGGQLELLASAPGGSEFRLSLPLVEPVPTPVTSGTPLAKPGGQALIVAASRFESAFLAIQLQQIGFVAESVGTAAAAMARLARAPAPELMIVDSALGTAVSQPLAQAAAQAKIGKALILFSPAERRAFGETLTQGYSGWLVKPVRSQSLLRLLGIDRPVAVPSSLLPPVIARLQGLRVLLADDNDINALVATHQLQRLGGQVTRAVDGPAALAIARRAILGETPPFGLILLDIRMPGLDGRSVARAIRQAEREAAVSPARIMALTASIGAGEGEEISAAGIDNVLIKPLDPAMMQALLLADPALQRCA